MTTTTIVILICAIAAIAVLALYFVRRRQTEQLRQRFGPEYQYAVRQYGGQVKAEGALLERQKRRDKLHIRSLSADEKERFSEEWFDVQRRFVDNPPGSIREADALVSEVLEKRGYPVADFDHRAEDLSVDHPLVVRNFRAAHEIALRHEQGKASTEDLRQALVYYRELFDDLLEAQSTTGSRGTKR